MKQPIFQEETQENLENAGKGVIMGNSNQTQRLSAPARNKDRQESRPAAEKGSAVCGFGISLKSGALERFLTKGATGTVRYHGTECLRSKQKPGWYRGWMFFDKRQPFVPFWTQGFFCV